MSQVVLLVVVVVVVVVVGQSAETWYREMAQKYPQFDWEPPRQSGYWLADLQEPSIESRPKAVPASSALLRVRCTHGRRLVEDFKRRRILARHRKKGGDGCSDKVLIHSSQTGRRRVKEDDNLIFKWMRAEN